MPLATDYPSEMLGRDLKSQARELNDACHLRGFPIYTVPASLPQALPPVGYELVRINRV